MQHHIEPYRICRRQYAHESLLVAHYPLSISYQSLLALPKRMACVEAMLPYDIVADLRGPIWAGRKHCIEPYRLNRRQYTHEPHLVVHYS